MMPARKWLILTHRYLGIPLSVVFVVWFVSGIAMIWARGMPGLTEDLRLERLPALDLTRVLLTPLEAAERVFLETDAGQLVLRNIMERPAYRFGRRGGVVFADTGEVLDELDTTEILAVAGRFMGMPPEDLVHDGILTRPDQWTIGASAELPLHRILADDADGTELYVSPRSGEVEVLTTRAGRALAWVAAIPHWFYFAALRTNGPLWSQVVIWSALVGSVFAVLGVALGIVQLSWARPLHVPYRGAMRWHHITGLVFGILTLTWVFSGMLSMDPWGWATGGGLRTGPARSALSGGPLEPALFPEMDAAAWKERVLSGKGVKEISFIRIQGAPYYDTLLDDGVRLLVAATPLEVRQVPFSTESIVSRVRNASHEAEIVDEALLENYDSYYYSGTGEAPLPVLRMKFDDPDQTWFYIDPARSRLVRSVHYRQRIDRWIYNGFHSLDFGFWYQNREVWTAGVVILCLGGLVSSGLGMYLGFRRLYRGARRIL